MVFEFLDDILKGRGGKASTGIQETMTEVLKDQHRFSKAVRSGSVEAEDLEVIWYFAL